MYGVFEKDWPISHRFHLSSLLDWRSSHFMTFFSPVFALQEEFSLNYPAMNVGFNHSLSQNIYTGSL